jgi:hypothetical protein
MSAGVMGRMDASGGRRRVRPGVVDGVDVVVDVDVD